MSGHRIFQTAFAKVYPMYVQKAERKGRTREEAKDREMYSENPGGKGHT